MIDPRIEVVTEGLSAAATLFRSGEERATIALSLEATGIQRPIEVVEGPLGEWCSPIVEVRTLTTTLVLPDGGAVRLPPFRLGDRALLPVLRMRLIRPTSVDGSLRQGGRRGPRTPVQGEADRGLPAGGAGR